MRILESKRTFRVLLCAFEFLGVFLFFSPATSHAQNTDAVTDLATRINRERTTRGMDPYALSLSLSAAAQAHADDISRTGINSHTGSDGSDVRERVGRAGYGAYSWGRRVGENWAWYPDAATAMQMWMNSPMHTHNILHPVYREFGIGIAPGKMGNYIYVVDFGAQPNVLPIFIQGDGRDGSTGRITLALSNENYATSGDGANTIGLAIAVEISNSPDFSGAEWLTFAPRFEWVMSQASKSVFVKYRDARGRMTLSSNSADRGAFAVGSGPKASAGFAPLPHPSATRNALPQFASALESIALPSPTAVSRQEPLLGPSARITLSDSFAPLPGSAESLDPLEDDDTRWVDLGIIGVATMLGVLATAVYARTRTKQ